MKECGRVPKKSPRNCNLFKNWFYDLEDFSQISDEMIDISEDELKILSCNFELEEKDPAEICKKIQEQLPSQAWMDLQRDYIENLDRDDKILVSYYGTGFAKTNWNGFLLEKLKNPKIPSKFKKIFGENSSKGALKVMTDRFNEIIKNAPPLDKNIIVYRGEETSWLPKKRNSAFTMDNFISTSLLPEISFIYASGGGPGGALTQIILPKGQNVLYISPIAGDGSAEMEIVLPSKSTFGILSNQVHNKPFCVEDIDRYDEETTFYNVVGIDFNRVKLL